MKNFFKIFIPLFLSVLIFIIVYVVDTTFYNVPNFIKSFRIEREIGLIAGIFLAGIFAHSIIKLNRRSYYFLSIGLLLSMSLFWGVNGILAYLLRDYLELWGKSPLLAEFPVYWNIYSAFITFLTFIGISFTILIADELVRIKKSITVYIMWYGCLFFCLILSVYLMISENRYTYEPINVVNFNFISILLSSIIIMLSLSASFHIGLFNCYQGFKRIIYVFTLVITLGISLVLPVSKLVYPVILMGGFTHGAFLSSILVLNGFILGQLMNYLRDLLRKREDVNESYRLVYNLSQLLNQSKCEDYVTSLLRIFCEEVKKIYSVDLYCFAREQAGKVDAFRSEESIECKELFPKVMENINDHIRCGEQEFYIIDDKKILDICGKMANSLLFIPFVFSRSEKLYAIFGDRRDCYFRFINFEVLRNMYNQVKALYFLLLRLKERGET